MRGANDGGRRCGLLQSMNRWVVLVVVGGIIVGSNLSYSMSLSLLVVMESMDLSTSEDPHVSTPVGPGNSTIGEDYEDGLGHRRIFPLQDDKRLSPISDGSRDIASIPQAPTLTQTPTASMNTLHHSHHRHTIVPKNRREHLVRLLKVTLEIVQVDHDNTNAMVASSFDTLSITELEDALSQHLVGANLDYLLSIPTNSTSGATTPLIVPRSIESHSSIRLLENILGVRTYRKSSYKRKPQKTFSHFLSHIPKSGASYAFGLLCDMLWNQAEYLQLSPSDRFRPCSVGTAQPYSFDSSWRGHTKTHVCNLWMSEAAWTPLAEHTMIVLRNPSHHVLSQYFHCAESSEHGERRRAKFRSSTTLTGWLTVWRDALEMVDAPAAAAATTTPPSNESEKKNMTTTWSLSSLAERTKKLNQFECYNPINLQSTYVFPSLSKKSRDLMKVTSRTNLTALYEYLYSTTKKNEQHPKDEKEDEEQLSLFKKTLYDDLQDRFVVVGDTSQMIVSVCLMFIHYTNWIPASCDCSTGSHGTTATGPVVRAFDPVKDSHGVQHHGSTYRTNVEQRQLIHELTLVDELLYEVGRQVLHEQIERVEHDYEIRLCRSL